jgi:hypothetical protein
LQDRNLKPKSGPEHVVIAFVAAFYSKLPANRAGKRIPRKIRKAPGRLIAGGFDPVQFYADLITDEVGAVAVSKKYRGIAGIYFGQVSAPSAVDRLRARCEHSRSGLRFVISRSDL